MKAVRFGVLLASLSYSLISYGQEEHAEADSTEAVGELSVEQALVDEYEAWAEELWGSIEQRSGTISIPQANAELTLPESFYFLSAEDAEKVLVEVWGNPPGQAVLGMIFPANTTPFDENSWAATVEYVDDGYVADDDAAEIDYGQLLADMQADTRDESRERERLGYGTVELVGWAAPPFYDAENHKLHWAQELNFDNAEHNTLNYNIRVLGRRGVLLLNFIAGMDQKAAIDANIDTVLAMASFEAGLQYADFDPSIDQVAAYGIGALVAGKLAAKTGILAAAVLLLKKFGVFIVLALGALIKGLWSRRKSAKVGSEA